MLTVHLKDIRFFAYHGVYDGESKVGTEYKVDLSVSYPEDDIKFDKLGNVIDYVQLFQLVSKQMQIPSPLLERAADAVISEIIGQYSFVKEISISIFKLNPPIENFQGAVGVTLHKKFDEA